ncbi:PPOX class F420-dependent oxidoreductase [Rhizohabitans arisaemae]|uniref:PPOX class F420-dependent oxidoreductase n=1 Tax=Rhizohabitans arisaemae TaxID=2720610 RepID=UPI0024B26073|nr:PPOX class F420-dependent oxidoreductase [Rhizohabitans arisaemae]
MTELSPNARALFDAKNFVTLSTLNEDGSPQTSVIWAKTDGDDLLFSTVKGRRKYGNLARDPRLSALVIDPANPYKYIEVRGRASLADDPQGELIQELSQKYMGQAYRFDTPEMERVIVRVSPEKVIVHG